MKIDVLSALHEAKSRHGELTPEVQRRLAAEWEKPLSEVSAVATFYSAFNGMDDGEPDDRFLEKTGCEGPMLSHTAGFHAAKKAVEEKTDILALLEREKLRGRSGSGFPAAKKWALTRDTNAPEKIIVCNASEGEGDTFKDYALLCRVPHAVIEGMVLCALATGIEKGVIHVRAEYGRAFESVQTAIERAYSDGILGENFLGTGKRFELRAVLGGGAYVSGEETGLLQALEGKRAEPRLKPPYPGVAGLYGAPTIINNAETFAEAAALLSGGEATKLFTVSGAVAHPCIYETSAGITVGELLKLAGGGAVKGFQLGGGATGSFAGLSKLDTVLDFAECRAAGLSLGTGSVRFIGKEESVPELALRSIAFLKDQSCGLCTPCKYGLEALWEALRNGEAAAELGALCDYIGQNARCALGQASPAAVITALRAFPEEFERLCGKEGE